MEVLQVFRQRYPAVATAVRLGFEDEILGGLRDFDCDVGVVGRPVDDPELCCEFYNRHRVLVIVHADHRSPRGAASASKSSKVATWCCARPSPPPAGRSTAP